MKYYITAIKNNVTGDKFIWAFYSNDPITDIENNIIRIGLGWNLDDCMYFYRIRTNETVKKALKWVDS
jgi:hypothetical protein